MTARLFSITSGSHTAAGDESPRRELPPRMNSTVDSSKTAASCAGRIASPCSTLRDDVRCLGRARLDPAVRSSFGEASLGLRGAGGAVPPGSSLEQKVDVEPYPRSVGIRPATYVGFANEPSPSSPRGCVNRRRETVRPRAHQERQAQVPRACTANKVGYNR